MPVLIFVLKYFYKFVLFSWYLVFQIPNIKYFAELGV